MGLSTSNRRAGFNSIRSAAIETLEGRQLLSTVLPNTTTSGFISSSGESDEYTFSVSAGDRVLLSLGKASGTNYQPRLVVYDPAGNVISNDVGYQAAISEFTAATSGTFTAHAREWDNRDTGGYRLHYAKVPSSGTGFDAADGEGKTLASNTTTNGAIATPGDFDVYTFNAAVGERVVLSLGKSGGTSYQPRLKVYDPTGKLLANDVGYQAANAEFTAAASGKFSVVAGEWDNADTGSYALHFAKLPHTGSAVNPADGHGKLLAPNSITAATIGTPGDFDVYSLKANAGDRILLSMGNTGGTSYQPRMKVYDTTGKLLANDVSYTAAKYEFTAATTGTYFVVAGEWDNADTGSYNLHYIKAPFTGSATDPADGQGKALAKGSNTAGAIGTPGDLDLYTFNSSVGARNVISLQKTGGTSYQPRLRVYDPTGKLLANDVDYQAAGYEFTAKTAGTYYIVAGEWDGGDTGAYNLSFQQIGGATTAPEAGVFGNSVAITDGDTTPSTADFTDFGSVAKGAAAVSRSFTVRNTGSATLTTSGLTAPAGFAISEGLSATIPAGGSDSFTVRLNTATAGSFAGNIVFTCNDADEGTYNFAVKGLVTTAGPSFAKLVNGVVTVTGTGSADLIRGSIASNILTLRLNNLTQTFANASSISRIVVNALGGNDTVIMAPSVNRATTINGGDGDDIIVGSSAADLINGGAGYDIATKGAGDSLSLVEEILA